VPELLSFCKAMWWPRVGQVGDQQQGVSTADLTYAIAENGAM
jgi:hypothetical protein